jgi:hypothetical protein
VSEGEELCKTLWRTLRDDLGETVYVYTVDPEYVASFVDVGWAEGGHGYVDPYTPKDEVWLGQHLSERRKERVLVHEMRERRLMRDGQAYDPAHHDANAAEADFRRMVDEVPAPHVGD